MKALNAIEQMCFRDVPCPILATLYRLTFEHAEKATADGVVAAMTDGADRTHRLGLHTGTDG